MVEQISTQWCQSVSLKNRYHKGKYYTHSHSPGGKQPVSTWQTLLSSNSQHLKYTGAILSRYDCLFPTSFLSRNFICSELLSPTAEKILTAGLLALIWLAVHSYTARQHGWCMWTSVGFILNYRDAGRSQSWNVIYWNFLLASFGMQSNSHLTVWFHLPWTWMTDIL